MMELSDVLARLSPDGIVEIWRRTWGIGGPHNRGPIDMGKLEALSQMVQSLPSGTHPSVPAGMALHAITFGRPFWDCNKRTGWSVCATIMSATGHAQSISNEAVEELVLRVENGELTETETISEMRKAFFRYQAKSS